MKIQEGTTKTNRPRMIDLDPVTVGILKSRRKDRAGLALALVRDDSLIFSDLEGQHLHPERFSRTFQNTLKRCAKGLGDDAPPVIRLTICGTGTPRSCWPTCARTSRSCPSGWATPE